MIPDEGGQTAVEYLMISAILTTIAGLALAYLYGPFVRNFLQLIVDRVINDPVL